MHTRHWAFGIALPAMIAGVAILTGFGSPEELESANATASLWVGIASSIAIGVADWIKNSGKQVAPASVKTDVKTETITPVIAES